MILPALAGGALIGAASGGLLLVNGHIAGISGILSRSTGKAAQPWQWGFVAGLLAAGATASLTGLKTIPAGGLTPTVVLVVAGLLVGVGTKLGSGCTSGHGVCGLANLSRRSLAATATFMLFAAVTVFITHHLS